MATERTQLEVILQGLAESDERSPLFHYFCKHYDELIQAKGKNRVGWPGMVQRLANAGVTDKSGKTPTTRNARETWYQVRRYIAALRADELEKHSPIKPVPSRQPVTVRPLVGPAPNPTPAIPPEPRHAERLGTDIPALSRSRLSAPQKPPDPTAKPRSEMTGAEKIAALQQTLKDKY